MQIQRPVVLAALGLTVLSLAACGKSDKAAPQAPPPPEVTVVTIAPHAVSVTTQLAGRTTAYQVAEVRPQVGGIIQKRQFTEGGSVKAGQSLYQIDPATYQAAYDSARAALARAQANLTAQQSTAKRTKELAAIDAVSQQSNDDAVAALAQAEADIASEKAAVETARINLAYTKVTSPITGRIGKSSVTAGALVTASQTTALATVQQLDPMYVDVSQSSTDLMRLRRDLAAGRLKSAGADTATVRLMLEDGSPYSLPGKIEFADVAVDPTTGSVIIRAVFPNPKSELLPGMFVRTILEEGINQKAITLQQQAVSRDTKGDATVMIVNADSKVEARTIKTDRALGDQWLITGGIAAGDKVIVEGLQKVRPGVQVKAVERAAAAPAQAAPAQAAPADAAPANTK
ncbi:efflux RND transporter periplasmic adaptor subunit [soil metagenome]